MYFGSGSDRRPPVFVVGAGQEVQDGVGVGGESGGQRDRVHTGADRSRGDRRHIEEYPHGRHATRRVRGGYWDMPSGVL
jgi:hypothetical protein